MLPLAIVSSETLHRSPPRMSDQSGQMRTHSIIADRPVDAVKLLDKLVPDAFPLLLFKSCRLCSVQEFVIL
jgi:hypothetical protein